MPRRLVITNKEKLTFFIEIDRRTHAGETLRAVCRSLSIQPCQARRWRQQRDKLEDPAGSHRGAVSTGRQSILAPVQDELLQWFFCLRAQGIMLSTRLVVVKASTLSAEFRRKTTRAKELAVRRLLASNRIVTRAVTHTCQRPPEEVRQEALDFIHYLREKVVGVNRSNDYIINMDQTPVFFDMPSGRTLNQQGTTFFVVLLPFLFY